MRRPNQLDPQWHPGLRIESYRTDQGRKAEKVEQLGVGQIEGGENALTMERGRGGPWGQQKQSVVAHRIGHLSAQLTQLVDHL